jgi:hypothetical protein
VRLSEYPKMLRRYWLAVASHRRSTHTNYLTLLVKELARGASREARLYRTSLASQPSASTRHCLADRRRRILHSAFESSTPSISPADRGRRLQRRRAFYAGAPACQHLRARLSRQASRTRAKRRFPTCTT